MKRSHSLICQSSIAALLTLSVFSRAQAQDTQVYDVSNPANVLVLSGANSYSGNTVVSTGMLRAGSSGAFGDATGITDVASGT